jgi:D-amino peptidase
MIPACLAILILVAAAPAQQNKLKVYISTDMEGIGGVDTLVQTQPQGRDYEKFRRLMTLEVNAAITGAYDAGATEVLVSDSHGDAQNIDIELLDKRARIVRAWPRPLMMMQGIDSSFDAVVFIGYHASEGTAGAILSHTFSGSEAVSLNGRPVPEAGFNAAIAGDFGVPVVFLSGDQTIADEARRLLGPIETAVVKQAIGYTSAITIHPELSQQLIREGVKRGIERRKEIPPFKLPHPVRLEVTYKTTLIAEVASYLRGVERISGNTIAFNAQDMIEASKYRTVLSLIRP